MGCELDGGLVCHMAHMGDILDAASARDRHSSSVVFTFHSTARHGGGGGHMSRVFFIGKMMLD